MVLYLSLLDVVIGVLSSMMIGSLSRIELVGLLGLFSCCYIGVFVLCPFCVVLSVGI